MTSRTGLDYEEVAKEIHYRNTRETSKRVNWERWDYRDAANHLRKRVRNPDSGSG